MQAETNIQYRKTVCPLDCPDSCGIIAKVVDGKVVSLAGATDHPYTNGYICRKMRSYPERVYSSERILYPQLRVGRKGEGRFKRISWDEALEILAGKLMAVKQEHGGEAILPFQYAGNMGAVNRNAGYGLYHKLGASRLQETICSAAAGAGWAMHLDDVPGSPPEVAEDARLIVAWGINVKVTNIHFWQYIAKARKKGARLLVIDPYRNETAKSADSYLQIQPGGDGALALGAIKSLLAANRIDRKMLEEQTSDFDSLASYLEKTDWQEFCEQSGLTRQQIEEFAMLLAAHPETFIRIGIGLSRNSRGGMSIRSIISLGAVLGLYSGGRGQGVLLFSRAFGGNIDKLRFPELSDNTTRVVNMAHIGHALTALEPPVRLFFVYSSNPLSVAPDASRVRQGLAREDLFTVVHEQVMTPTASYADLLLPATTFLENKDLYTGYGHFYMGVVEAAISPIGEAKSNFDLFQLLAERMGFTDEPFRHDVETRISGYVETMKGLPEDFAYSPSVCGNWFLSTRRRLSESVMERWKEPFRFKAKCDPQISPIPCLQPAREFADNDLRSRFPFKLITPPHRDLLNSTFGERYPGQTGEVLIHPEDAASYKIPDGARVVLRNHRGTAVRIARVTTDTAKGLLVAEGIFWQTEQKGGAINDLTSQKTTDIGAGPTFHESRVGVFVVDTPEG